MYCLKLARMAALPTFLFFMSIVSIVLARSYKRFVAMPLPQGVVGPESVTLDEFSRGPYITTSDGRILMWQDASVGFVDFAYTSQNRTKELCDGKDDPNWGHVCGRPESISFDYLRGDMYIADAFRGLFMVGRRGGQAKLVADNAEGVPFGYLSGVDVDVVTRDVYLSDASTRFNRRDVSQLNFQPDATGRLMVYRQKTKNITVLMRGLSWATGPAISVDRSCIFVSERGAKRIQKFWIKGPKEYKGEVVLNLPANPSTIKRSVWGDFWIAMNENDQSPQITVPQAIKVDLQGRVKQTLNLSMEYYNTSITVAHRETDGGLYIGSRDANFVGILRS